MGNSLHVGDRVRLSGGYDMEPPWLQGHREYFGTVISFIPGQNDGPAATIQLESPIPIDGILATIAVLELRYVGATWNSRNTVHIELCDFEPEPKRWNDRRQGKWVESHATYERC